MNARDAVAALTALAHDSRLQVFRLLVQQGPQGMPVGAINKQVHIPATTLSFHLSQLSHAGLVTSKRLGRSIIYTANYKGMQGLMDFLMENCCQGDSGACAPMKGSDNAGKNGVEGELLRPNLLRRGGDSAS